MRLATRWPDRLNRGRSREAGFVEIDQAALPIAGSLLQFRERDGLHGEVLLVALFLSEYRARLHEKPARLSATARVSTRQGIRAPCTHSMRCALSLRVLGA